LYLLVLEDNPSDAELMIHELRRADFEPVWKRVETEGDFLTALDPALDLILADYHLPQFDGLRALKLVQESKLGIPLLLVSGTVGEEFAVEAMKKGAADYLLKDRLARLGPAVKQVLERKQVEEKLAVSENELRSLFAAMTDVVFVFDADGRYLEIAPTNPVNLYHPAEDLLGKTVHEVLPKEQAGYMMSKIQAALQKNQTVPGEYALQIDGKEVWFETNASRLSENSVIWVAHDITARKRAEEALRESEEKFRMLIDNSVAGIYIIQNAKMAYVNPSFAKAFGYVPEEINGRLSPKDLIHPDDIQAVMRRLQERLDGQTEKTTIAYKGIKKDGSIIYFEVYGMSITYLGRPAVMGTLMNITERKRAEEKVKEYSEHLEEMVAERTSELCQAQEELVRKEKLAVLGTLAGGVGHELRNPLGVISNSVYYLKMVQPKANEKIKKHHDIIEQELHNATRIVSDLLDYAREIFTEPQPGSVSELVEYTLSCFPVPGSIQVSLRIPADLPQIYADPLHVQQILGNLVTNACQAMADPSLDAKAGSATTSGRCKLTISAQQKKQMVVIAVKDTGAGINPENIEKLFEPLFSTKAKGIGLGLAVSKKLAEANGGRIEVKTQVGKGSTFTLYLPVLSSDIGN
jgi:PAS domain S-box-containing protein